jgi:hypothetical protein
MVLTPDQEARIRANRERALALQKARKEQKEKEEIQKRSKKDNKEQEQNSKRQKLEEENDDVELEEFEEQASEFVTKTEAMKMYCLPEGTMAVCQFMEKDNPHHKGWTPMKMYWRSEIRMRARKRFGGLEGLVAERKKREERRFAKDLEKAKDIFEK